MAVIEINSKELKNLINKGDEVDLIDVRTKEEFSEDHIENSKNFSMDTVMDKSEGIDWGKKVVFICRSGARSSFIAQRFSDEGKEVYNLHGGIMRF